MTDLVLREQRGSAAHLILNRPDKLNSLNVPVFEALDAHVRAIADDPSGVAAVVLRGAGRCFSAGHDLGDIATGEKLPEPHYQSNVIERLAGLPLPVVTAVHGHCYTGALELALAGDLILAAESARFADTHAKWALTPVWGLSQRLPRRVGATKTREMMFTCRTYSGREAEAMGLANLTVPDAELEGAVEALTSEILGNSSFSHAANKRLLMATDGLPQRVGLAHEIHRGEGRGPDMAERIAAFTKRAR
jgi:enoyl-CoA hydratase/carnithine racemase